MAGPSSGRAGSAIVRAGALSMLALIAVGGTRLVHGSLTSHSTDRTTYGLVGIMLAASMVASLVLPGGVSSGLSKFVAFHRGAGDVAGAWAVHRFLYRLGLVASLVLGAATTIAVNAFHPLKPWDLASLALLTITYSLYTLDKAALYGHGLVARYARIEVGTSLLAVASTVAVVVTARTTYLLPLCLGYGLFVVLSRWQLRLHRRREVVPTGGRFHRREIVTFTVLASIGTLASAGFLQGTQLLAGQFVTPAEVAYLVAAIALTAPLYFLPRALALALFPAMAGAQGAGDTGAVRRQVDAATRALAVTMTPLFLAGLMAAPLILTLFGGSAYADGAQVLRVMLCASFIGILQVPSVNALASDAAARTRIPVASAVVGCVTGLAVAAWTAPTLGATGIAVGYLVGTTVTAAIPVIAVQRLHRLQWGPILVRCVGLLTGGALLAHSDLMRTWTWSAAAISVGVLTVAAAVLRSDLRALLRVLQARRRSATEAG
ncbi:lipopolysaccharide biosynthesis protein [Micromonospora sp. NPDC049374]|uniref:lipopolysaccharide biosynthesis protein n=1 Tax=Micromonospora sp. NPDC049374 TaxID=3154352 RepID=UPI0034185791